MATGTLLPDPRPQYFDANGDPLAGGLLYTYAAGTVTPLATYTDVGLTTPHANPIVLDAAGRPSAGIYQSAASYKIVLKTAGGVTLWTQDNVAAIALSAISSTINDICDFRLTLTSVTPVTTADVLAATTLYVTPYKGSRVALYDGSGWAIYSASELSLALGSDAANTNYDVFAYVSAGAVAIERLAWSSATVRATALAMQDGVLVKGGNATRRYLGTYRTTAVIGQTEDSNAKRFVWNFMHRVATALRVVEATDSWTYTLAAWRQANGSAANQVGVVVGWSEDALDVQVVGLAHNATLGAGNNYFVAVGEDTTTAPMPGQLGMSGSSYATATVGQLSARALTVPAVGYHFYAWLEYSTAVGTTTWAGDGGGTLNQAGIHAMWRR